MEVSQIVSWLSLLAAAIGTTLVILNSAVLFILTDIKRRVERLENILFSPFDDVKERRAHAR